MKMLSNFLNASEWKCADDFELNNVYFQTLWYCLQPLNPLSIFNHLLFIYLFTISHFFLQFIEITDADMSKLPNYILHNCSISALLDDPIKMCILWSGWSIVLLCVCVANQIKIKTCNQRRLFFMWKEAMYNDSAPLAINFGCFINFLLMKSKILSRFTYIYLGHKKY